jgi:hypothetical protein
VRPNDFLGTQLKSTSLTAFDNATVRVAAIDTGEQVVSLVIYTDDYVFDRIALYTNSFFTIKPITGVLQSGSTLVTGVQNLEMLNNGDFITFDGASRCYRIIGVNYGDSSIVLSEKVTGNSGGRVAIFNTLLLQHTQPSANSVRMVSKSCQLNADDRTVIVKEHTGDVTLTLPIGVAMGTSISIKGGKGSGKIIITAPGLTIDGNSAYTFNTPYQGATFLFDGSEFVVIR